MKNKERMGSIRQRNLVIENILNAATSRDSFLITGHRHPDEDCISSMIAISLLLSKLSKTAYIMIPDKINENYRYLLTICKYNEIEVLSSQSVLNYDFSTIFIMDSPKPAMREPFLEAELLFSDESILKIEIDHHLGADSGYNGSEGYCLVDEASSASELVGMMAFKMKNHSESVKLLNGQELFSRNFVLAVLTGIIGDSKMGKYLKTNREKWFYKLFSGMFNEMLANKTRQNSNNFSTMKEVFSELQQLSHMEDKCFNFMMGQELYVSPNIGCVIMKKEIMTRMTSEYDHDTIVTVARYTADHLAEKSRKLSLVVYYDEREGGDLYQFRIRRSQDYQGLDLREILSTFEIKNGGGHPGAIGFRIPAGDIQEIMEYIQTLRAGIEKLMGILA